MLFVRSQYYNILILPNLSSTDASETAISAVLSQGQIGKDRPISYSSRVLNDAEKNYSTIEK